MLLSAVGVAKILVPGGDFLLNADYIRQGANLVLVGGDGTRVVIQDYFASESPPPLLNDAGATIDAALASKLAGPLAPGQYAQADGDSGATAIGKIQTLNGTVHVKHADGTTSDLHKGDNVLQGDVLQTDPASAVGVVFADGTTMSLGEKGRLVLDELAYDPGAKTGDAHLTLVSGSFAMVSGQIPKTTPDALQLKTPTMTVGIRGTGVAGNGNTMAMMAEKGGVTGEISVTTASGTTLTLNAPGAAAVLGPGGTLTATTMSPLQVMQVAGNAGAALPNAANLLSASFNQAAQQVQQQIQQQQQQQQQTPPPPVTPPTTGQGAQGAVNALAQVQAQHDAQVQTAVKQIAAIQAAVADAIKLQVAQATTAAVVQFHQFLAATQAAEDNSAALAKADFTQVMAYYAQVVSHVTAATTYANASPADTYHANIELTAAQAAQTTMLQYAAKITAEASGHGAAALTYITELTNPGVDNNNVAPVTDAASRIGTAQAAIDAVNSNFSSKWSDSTSTGLIQLRATADGTLADDTAILVVKKAAAETAVATAHAALLSLETPLVNAAAADAVLGVQTGALVDVVTNYLAAAKTVLGAGITVPTGWTSAQAELAVAQYDTGANSLGLIQSDIDAVNLLETALTTANGSADTLVVLWKNALADAQSAYLVASTNATAATNVLSAAQTAADNAQQASVDAANLYASQQSQVSTDTQADGYAIAAEHAGEAAWQSGLDTTIANALTSAKSALALATTAATNAATDAATALANAATGHFSVAAATAAKLAADGEVTNATTADSSAATALSNALGVLHSYGIDANGNAWSGSATNPAPTNLSSALTSDQTAVTSAKQAALALYQQIAAVKAQADQQLAVAQQQDTAAIQSLAQAQALQLQVDLLNAATVGDAQTNADIADTGAHTAAASASAAATAAAASRDALKVVLDALNSSTAPANVTGAALADFNTQKAALVATVQGYYTTAVTAANTASTAASTAGFDVTTADSNKVLAHGVTAGDVSGAKTYSGNTAQAAADAGTQASTANTAAGTAAAQLALAANAKASLAQIASDASAAQSRADDVAAALAAKTDVHAIVNAASSPTTGSLVTLQSSVQTEYNTLLAQLGSVTDTGTTTLYGLWNLASAAKTAADAAGTQSTAASAAKASADSAYTAINTALNNALTAKAAFTNASTGVLQAITTQVSAAEAALTAVDTAYSAAISAQTAKTSTSTALAQAVQADQAAQQALASATSSQKTADQQAATATQQLAAAQSKIASAVNAAAQAADATANADATTAQAAASSAATYDTSARTHATDSDSTVRASTQTDATNAAGQATAAKLAFADLVTQVQAAVTQAGTAPAGTPAAVLATIKTVAADVSAYGAALDAYNTSPTTTTLAAVTSALSTLNTDLTTAQGIVNTANTTAATAGLAANEAFRAEQAAVTAGAAYLKAAQSSADAQAAYAFAQNYNPAAEIAYWKSVYDSAVTSTLNAKTAATNALAAGLSAKANADTASGDITTYLGGTTLPHTSTDAAGKAQTAANTADTTANTVLGAVSDTSSAHTIYGQKAAIDGAYATVAGTAFDSSSVNAAKIAAQAVADQAATAATASSLVQQLAGLATQSANTAIAQDSAVHALGLQWSSPTLAADSVYVAVNTTTSGGTVVSSGGATTVVDIDVLANDHTGAGNVAAGLLYNGSTALLANYTLTAGTASHGSVAVVSVGGHDQLEYTATAGYAGPDSFTYTVTYTDPSTTKSVSAVANVSVVVEGASVTVPSTATVVENGSTSVSLAVADVNANETVGSVTISTAQVGTVLTYGTTSITSTGSNVLTLTAAQAKSAIISVTPATDFSGQVVLSVSAATTNTSSGAAVTSATTTKTVAVTVTPVTQGATITAPSTVSGVENAALSLPLSFSDSHTGETITAVKISGLATGSTLVLSGTTLTPDANGLITLPGSLTAGGTFSLHTPSNTYGDSTLLVSVTSQNGTATPVTVTKSVPVHVDATALGASDALAAAVSSGNTRVSDTAAHINAATVAALQAHGITTIDVTDAGTLDVTAVQAQTLKFSTSGGGHLAVLDTAANINTAGIGSLVSHGFTDIEMSTSGSVSLSGGTGAYSLTGGSGNDTYVVPATASGSLTLIDTGGTNVLDVTNVIQNGFLGAAQSGSDLVLYLSQAGGGGTMTIKNEFAGTGGGIDHIHSGSSNNPNQGIIGALAGGGAPNHGGVANFVSGDGHQEISVANASDLTMGTAVTIEAWINPTSTSNNQILMKGEYGYAIGLENGHVEYWVDGSQGNTIKSTGTVTAGVWTHIAVVVDTNANTTSFYINGTLSNVINSAVITNNADPLHIGQQTSSAYNTFAGQIDEIRLWNTTLSASQVSANMTTTPASNSAGLVADWKFGEGSGTITADATGNGHTGTLGAYASLSGTDGSGLSIPNTLTGTSASEMILGNLGEATLIGGGGKDQFFAGGGNQTIIGDGTTIAVNQGGGIVGGRVDFALAPGTVVGTVAGAGSSTVTITNGTSGTWTDTLTNITELVGSAYNDTLTGGTGYIVLDGMGGNNTLIGGGTQTQVSYDHAGTGVIVNLSGSSLTVGGTIVAAHQALNGLGGTDTLSGIYSVRGSLGNDYIRGGGGGNYTLDGNGGTDTLVGGAGATSFRLTQGGTVVGNASYGNTLSYEDFTGGTLADSAFANVSGVRALSLDSETSAGTVTLGSVALTAGIGTINAWSDSQALTIDAHTRSDAISVNAGDANLVFKGGSGQDTLFIQGNEAGHTITVSGGTTTVTGGGVTDTMTGGTQTISFYDGSISLLNGGTTLMGGMGNDTLVAGSGVTTIFGGGGSDVLSSTSGNQTFVLSANTFAAGAETITAGTGSNILDLQAGTGTITDSAFGHISNVQTLTLESGVGGTISVGSLAQAAGLTTIDASADSSSLTIDASADSHAVSILAGSGIETIVGGSGSDTVKFAGTEASYSFSNDASGHLVVSGGGSTTTLSGVETLQFAGGTSLSVSAVAGTSASALQLSGSGTYLAVPQIIGAAGTGAQVSVSFDMNWSSTAGDVMVVGFGGSYDLLLNGNNIGFNTFNGSDIYGVTGAAALAGGWHSITAVFTQGNVHANELFIDGVLQSLSQLSSSPNDGAASLLGAINIGAGPGGSGAFTGQIADVQIHQRALTESEAVQYAQGQIISNSLLASYDFTGGSPLADKFGYGYNASIVGAAQPTITTFVTSTGSTTLIGSAGDDVIHAGTGNISLIDAGTGGNDTLISGAGQVTFRFEGGFDASVGHDSITGNTLSPSDMLDLVGVTGNTLTDASFANVVGVGMMKVEGVSSTLHLTLGDNAGAAGIQALDLSGTTGGVVLDASADMALHQIIGGSGNDILKAGAGILAMTGGAGSDTFAISAPLTYAQSNSLPLTISDFVSGTDKIDLSVGGSFGYIGTQTWQGSAAATFGGLAALTQQVVAFATDGTNGWLYVHGGSLDGSVIELSGVTSAPSLSDLVGVTGTAVGPHTISAVNSAITTVDGATFTLTPSYLKVYDPVAVADSALVYTVATPSANGTLTLNGSVLAANGTFTQDDVDHGRVKFIGSNLSGSRINTDIILTVSDGVVSGQSVDLSASIVQHGYSPPNLAVLIPGTITLDSGSHAGVSKAVINAFDSYAPDSQIVYTITAVPTHGVLTNNGTALSVGSTFTEGDIGYGLIYFNDGANSGSDAFSFTVTDGLVTSGPQTAHVSVTPVIHAPVAGYGAGNAASLSASNGINILNFNTVHDAVTVEAWVMPTWTGTIGSLHSVFAQGVSGNDNYALYLKEGANHTFSLVSVLGGQQLAGTSLSFSDAAWHHVAASFDAASGKVTLFVDGVASTPISFGGGELPTIPDANARIGLDEGTAGYVGLIDELRVWHAADAAGQITADMTNTVTGLESGLMADFHFDQSGYVSPVNSAASLLTATFTGTPSYVVSTHEPQVLTMGTGSASLTGNLLASDPDGLAMTYSEVSGPSHGTLTLDPLSGHFVYTPDFGFSGTDSITYAVTVGTMSSEATASLVVPATNHAPLVQSLATASQALQTDGSFGSCAKGALTAGTFQSGFATLECDVYVNTLSGGYDQDLINLSASGRAGPALVFGVNPSGDLFVYDGVTRIDTTLGVGTAGWHHVAVSYSEGDPATATVYIDGQAQHISLATQQTALGGLDTIRVGDANMTALNGQIDNVRLWDTIRTAQQIDTGAGAVVTGTENGLVGAWTFDASTPGGSLADLSGHQGALNLENSATLAISAGSTGISGSTTLAVIEDQSVSGHVVAFDQDGNGLTFTTASGGAPTHGTLTLNTAGAYTYSPTAGYYGADSFTVQVSDGTVSSTKTFQVNVADSTTISGVGQAAHVAAGNGVVATAKVNSGDLATNAATIEFDLNISATTAAASFPAALMTSGGAGLVQLMVDSNHKATLWVDGTNTSGGTVLVADGGWHHVTITVDGTADVPVAKLYIDGTLSSTVSGLSSTLLSQVATLDLGGATVDGLYDNVKLWNTVLPPDQIASGDANTSTTGLVGHWQFNGAGLGFANEVGGTTDNPMVLTANGHIAEPPIRAVHFDGSHLVTVSNPGLTTGSGAFTTVTWVRTSDTGRDELIDIGSGSGGPGTAMSFYVQGGQLHLDWNNVGGPNGTISVADGEWHQVAMAYDGNGNVTFYVDGKADGGGTISAPNINADVAYFGSAGWTNAFNLTGDLANVSVWNSALSTTQIQTLGNSNLSGQMNGLLGYWKLDEGAGTTAYNLVNSGHSGTYSGAMGWVDADHVDVISTHRAASALSFAGGQYASAGNIFNVGSGDFTIEAWVNPSSLSGNQMIVAKDTGGSTTQSVMSLFLQAGVPVLHIGGADGTGGQSYVLQGLSALSTGQWTHLAVSRYGDQYILYVNGQPVQTVEAPDVTVNNAYALMIGARTGSGGTGIDSATTFHGLIGGVNLWTTGMDPAAIKASMHDLTPSGDNLVASWSGASTTDLSGNSHGLTLSGATVTTGGAPIYDHLVAIKAGDVYHGAVVATDANHGVLSYAIQSNAGHGSVTLNADGTFAYTAAANYTGIDSFTVAVTTTQGGTTSVTTQSVVLGITDYVHVQGARQADGMHFDGTSYVALGSDVGQGSGPFTYEAWVRATPNGTGQTILSVGTNAAAQGLYLFLDGTGHLGLGEAFNGTAVGNSVVADGTWHHVAATITSGGAIRYYVDGQYDGSATGVAYNVTGAATIGVAFNGAFNFTGDIADARLWGAALSATQIQGNMYAEPTGSETELLGAWSLSQTSGTVTDSVGGHAGMVIGDHLTPSSVTAPVSDQEITAIYGGTYHGALAATSDHGDAASLTWKVAGQTAGASVATAHGTVVVNSDGSFTYTPNAGWHGIDYFTADAVGTGGHETTKAIAVQVPSPVVVLGAGAAGGALQFSGGQYAQSNNSISFADTKSFSFEFWSNRTAAGVAQDAISAGTALTAGWDATNHFVMNVNGTTISAADAGGTGQWEQWSGSYDSSSHSISLYENGVLVGGTTGVASFTAPSHITLGGSLYGGGTLSAGMVGQLDEVRLFSTALSGTDVLHDMASKTPNQSSAMVADWTMDRVASAIGGTLTQIVADSSYSGNDLTLGTGSQAPTYVNTAGKAAMFNGTSSGIHISNTSEMNNLSEDFTVETWFRLDAGGTNRPILSAVNGTGGSADEHAVFDLSVDGSNSLTFMMGNNDYSNNSGIGLNISGPSVSVGQWYHVAVSVHDNVATMYLDGSSVGSSAAFTGSRQGAMTSFDIGSYTNASTQTFDGAISDVRVWDYGLSASEIDNTIDHRLSGQEAGLVDNWRLDNVYTNGSSVQIAPDSTGNGDGTLTNVTTSSVKAKVYDDVITTREDTVATGGLMAFDTITPSAHMTVALTQAAAHGTVTISSGSITGTTSTVSYTYTPNSHYYGSDSFVIGVDDGTGNLTYETIGVAVTETHEAPRLTGSASLAVGENSTGTLSYTVVDPIGSANDHTYSVTLSAGHGGLTVGNTLGISFGSLTPNGGHTVTFTGTYDRVEAALASVTYAGDPGLSGNDTVHLKVWDKTSDPSGDTLVSSLSSNVTITHVNQAPVAWDLDSVQAFDGSSTYIHDQVDRYHTGGAFTITALIKPSSYSGTIIDMTDGTSSNEFKLAIDGSGHLQLTTILAANATVATSNATINLNAWTQISAVNDGNGTVSFYADDTLIGMASGQNARQSGATYSDNYLGTDRGTSVFFNGDMQSVHVWADARSTTQLWNEINGTFDETNELGWWVYNGNTWSQGTLMSSGGSLVVDNAVDVGNTLLHGQLVASDPEGSSLSYVVGGQTVTGAGTMTVNTGHGTLVVHGDGSYTYQPNAGYTGIDQIAWSATDGTASTGAFLTFADAASSVSQTTDGSWSAAGTWSTGTVPLASAMVTDAGYQLTHSSGSDTVGGIQLSDGGALTLSGGALTLVDGGEIGDTSNLMISGGSLTIGTHAELYVSSAGAVDFESGALLGAGTLYADSSGIVLAGVGKIDTINASLVLAKGGAMAGGRLTGSGTVYQTGGTLTLNDLGNDIGLTFQNAAAALLLVDAVNAAGASATLLENFDNLGGVELHNGSPGETSVGWQTDLSVAGTFTNDGSLLVDGHNNAYAHTIEATAFGNNGQMVVDHNLAVTTASFVNAGELTLGTTAANPTLTIQDSDPTSHASFVNHGKIDGTGWLAVHDAVFQSDGLILPGGSGTAGTLHIDGDLTLLTGSHIKLDIGVGGNSCDELTVGNGTLSLGGELDINWADTVSPGGTYTLLNHSNGIGDIEGNFNLIHGMDLVVGNNGWVLDPVFSSTGMTVSVTGATSILDANTVYSSPGSTNDYVIGNMGGNDTVHLGDGNDVFVGHGGNNIVGVTAQDFHYLDGGGAGAGNQLQWEASGSNPVLDLTKLSSPNVLQNFDVLNLSTAGQGGGSAVIDLAHVMAMTMGTNAVTGTANSLVVIGGTNSQVSFADSGWHNDGHVDLTVNNQHDSYTQYSNGNTHVLIDSHTHIA